MKSMSLYRSKCAWSTLFLDLIMIIIIILIVVFIIIMIPLDCVLRELGMGGSGARQHNLL